MPVYHVKILSFPFDSKPFNTFFNCGMGYLSVKQNTPVGANVTEFSLFGQKVYLSPILDLCSTDIVSYAISGRPVLSMVTEMLDKAFKRIANGTSLIRNPDKGWQYQHRQYQRMLNEKGIRQSMSQKETAWIMQ